MEKIIKLALGLSYPKEKLAALQEVINATPNPTMATEILLGVYEKPKVPSKVKTKEGVVRILKEVNLWAERVTFKYLKNKRIGAYYPKEVEEKQLNDMNWEGLKCSSSTEGSKYLYFTSKEMEEREEECNLQHWLECEDITPQRQFEDIYNA